MLSYSQNRVMSSVLLVVFILATITFTGISFMPGDVYAATSAFSQIEAENYSSLSTTNIQVIDINPSGYGLGYINTNNNVGYNNIDFGSSGTISFKAKVATQNNTTIQIRSGSSNGTLLGTLSVSSTGNYNTYQEMSCSVSNMTGIQNVYLVFGNAVNIDWFTFIQATTGPSSFDAYSQIEAESYSSLSGQNMKKVDISGGYGIGYINSGDFAVYNNVNFGSTGATSFKARIATQNNTTIQIRSGSSNGTLLGTLSVTSTGNYNTYQEISCSVSSVTGVHNIYLVFGNAVNIDWFKFTKVAAPTNTLTPTATPTRTPTAVVTPTRTPTPIVTPIATAASSGVLKVEFYNSNTDSSSNTIYTHFKVTNTSSSSLNLSAVKLRYFYTTDGTGTQILNCDHSSVAAANLNLVCSSLGTAYANADYYYEVGFKSEAGTLAPGATVDVNTRITNANWTNYNQSNDFSFNPSSAGYTEWSKVAAYINDTLVWGSQPNSSATTQAPTATPTIAFLPPSATPTATWTATSQPAAFSRIEAENYSSLGGQYIKVIDVKPEGYGLGFILKGDYALYNNVNFGNGASLFKIRLAAGSPSNIQLRIGNNTIGNLYVPSTGSWDAYQEFTCNINNTVTGYNNLYLEFSDPINIDWFVLSGAVSASTPTPMPTATPAPTTRSAFVQIQAESYDFTNSPYINTFSIPDGGYNIGWIHSGDYVAFNNIDFGSGTNSFRARIATTISSNMEIRSGSPTGTLLSTVSIPSTGSWETYQEVSLNVSNITGVKNLYFVFGEPVNVDWFIFSPTTASTSINAFSRIEAENCSGISDENIKKRNNIICYIQSGNYVVFNNVDFGAGAKSFKAYAVNASGSTTDIEIRLGSSTGTLVGTLSIPSMDNWDEYRELACNISTVTGKNNLYLVFTGPVNVDWLTFSTSAIAATPTPIPTITPTATPTPTSTIALAPPTPTPAASSTPFTIDPANLALGRTAPPRAELASIQTIYSTQEGELILNGMGTFEGEKEIVLLVDNAISTEEVMVDKITPIDFGIFANRNIRGVGDGAYVEGGMHANGKLESYIANLKVTGTCSASSLSIGYGSNIDGGLVTINSPLPMPVFHDDIIAEIDKVDYKFYPATYPGGLDYQFPNQTGFNIRYEENNNTFVITGAGTFNLESSMYFDGNLRISVPHIINTNSNFIVAEGFVNLEGHDINNAELDANSIENTTNLLNIYSIHGRIFVATSSSKIYGILYAAGEEDPTGKYTNDVGVVLLQGINTDIYGAIVAGSDIRIEGSSSRFICSLGITSKVETKYLRTTVTPVSAKDVAKQIVDKFADSATKMFAFQYSDKAYIDTESFEFFDLSTEGNKAADLKNYIDSFPDNSNGFSNMGDALRRGKELLTHTTKSSPDATKYLIVLAANAPNKWTVNPSTGTGDAISIAGDGTNDADGSALNYALNIAADIKASGIRPVFIDNSITDISANIENIAVAAGSSIGSDGKHYYSTNSMLDLSPIYRLVILDPPKTAVIKKATYIETFPEGIQVIEDPSYRVEPVGTTRQKLTMENLDIKLTHDGTKYRVEPFTVKIKVRPRKLGDIIFSGSDSSILYEIDYIDINGNKQTATFEKNFNDFTLNVYMSIDIS